jgi:hypothetical protein
MFIPVPLIRRKVIIRRFIKSGAVSPETANLFDREYIFPDTP